MGLLDFLKKKKSTDDATAEATIDPKPEETPPESTADTELTALLEQLPPTYSLNAAGLVEITDPLILARIEALVPSAHTTASSLKHLARDIQAQNGETLYRVILKKGGVLVDSATMPGAKRAMTMGEKGIAENANLIPVSQTSDKGVTIADTTSAAMGVASMVVGQYYMHQVSTQMSLIGDHLSKLIDTLDVQYKSEVASLMESVYNISKFQMSSIENEELRGRELTNIQELRKDCQRLLNQAETTIETLTGTTYSDYSEYESKIKEIEKWKQYQMILLKLLYQLNTLDFALHLGGKSQEQCFGSFSLHTDKVEKLHLRLVEWHTAQCKALKISLDESRREHSGLLGLMKKPIAWINDDWNYSQVGPETIQMIQAQTADIDKLEYTADSLFDDSVEIIIRDGKYYYLPKKQGE